MKKKTILLFLAVFVTGLLSASEEILFKFDCMDINLEPFTLKLSYDTKDDKVGLYESTDDYTVVSFWNKEQRDLLISAIDKAGKWKSVAIKNDVKKMSKDILPDVTIQLPSFFNVGDGWHPQTLRYNYQFLIGKFKGKIQYLFLLRYRTIDDLNNGNYGQFYVFKIGEDTSKLKGYFLPDAIDGYKKKINAGKNAEALFN